MYKLKSIDGKVKFLLRSGKDFVKNRMSVSGAQHIIDHGKRQPEEAEGYPINIEGVWHFEGERAKTTFAPDFLEEKQEETE